MLSKDIVDRLVELPKKIQEKEILLLDNSDEIEEIGLKLKLLETNAILDIQDTTGLDGKKLYTNKEKREVALKKRLDASDEYNSLKKIISDMRKKLEIDKIMIWYLKRKFSAAKALARLEVE